MSIDRMSPLPRHFQLGEAIKNDIIKNGMSEGDPIPSERTLSETYDVSRITVRRAIADLVKEGVLRREGRRGTFVNKISRINVWQQGTQRRLLGVIIPDIIDFFAARLISGIDDLGHESDYSLALGQSDENAERASHQISRFVEDGVAGLFFVPVACEDYRQVNTALLEQIKSANIPVVLIDRYLEGSQVDTVVSDNFDGSYRSTQHLVGRGHKRVAYIGYPRCSTLDERISGYKKCLMDNGIHPDEKLIVYPHPRRHREKTIEAVKELMELTPRVTAICTANDGVAMDVWAGLQEMGLRVPEDVAVVGYDNASGLVGPEALLSTTDPALYDQGRLACQMLIERLEGYQGEARFACLKSTFVPGRSTIPAPMKLVASVQVEDEDRPNPSLRDSHL